MVRTWKMLPTTNHAAYWHILCAAKKHVCPSVDHWPFWLDFDQDISLVVSGDHGVRPWSFEEVLTYQSILEDFFSDYKMWKRDFPYILGKWNVNIKTRKLREGIQDLESWPTGEKAKSIPNSIADHLKPTLTRCELRPSRLDYPECPHRVIGESVDAPALLDLDCIRPRRCMLAPGHLWTL